MIPNDKAPIRRPTLDDCVRFHGHFCPGLAIGFRAAEALMAALGAEERAEDEELVVIVETDACGVDAIQVMTGCTFGKGNFLFRDSGKHAFTLASRKSGRAFRACLKPVPPRDPERVALFEKVRDDRATPEELERFAEGHRRSGERIMELRADELFEIREITIDMPVKARTVDSAVCEGCGESVRVDYLVSVGGRRLCRQCSEKC